MADTPDSTPSVAPDPKAPRDTSTLSVDSASLSSATQSHALASQSFEESPRIQALIDRKIVFPNQDSDPSARQRFSRLRRKIPKAKHRIFTLKMLKSIALFLPQKIHLFWVGLTQPGLFVALFILLAAIGTSGLLFIPGLVRHGKLSTIDALFTMTSAASLTGLSTFDIGQRLTFFGQVWTLIFIQAGGILFYSFSTLFICAIGHRFSHGENVLASSLFTAHSEAGSSRQMLKNIAQFTLVTEGIGAVLLWPFMVDALTIKGIALGLWQSVFLAVISFCNSSMFLRANSLQAFSHTPVVLFVVTTLSILGGIGYLVLMEITQWVRLKQQEAEAEIAPFSSYLRTHKSAPRMKISLNTLCAISATPCLLFSGMILFLVFEWSGVLSGFGVVDRLMNAWTLSAMNRSAGMSSVDPSLVSNAGIYLSILMMFIGGSSGSMAGGLKVTTFAVLVAQAVSRIRGQRYVNLFGRAVPERVTERAGTIALIALFLVSISIFLLGWTESNSAMTIAQERRNFLPILYEAVSALTNTGISLNFTQTLTDGGKIIVIALMFIGRIGFLAFFSAICLKEKIGEGGFRPAVEDVFLG